MRGDILVDGPADNTGFGGTALPRDYADASALVLSEGDRKSLRRS